MCAQCRRLAAAILPGPKHPPAYLHDLQSGRLEIFTDGRWQAVTPETYWPTWRGQETPDAA